MATSFAQSSDAMCVNKCIKGASRREREREREAKGNATGDTAAEAGSLPSSEQIRSATCAPAAPKATERETDGMAEGEGPPKKDAT